MSRKRTDAPAYRYHVSGQARVTLAGKDFFLGEYDSPESRAKYFALLAEYNANGKQAPESTPSQLADAPITVRCVTAEFREHVRVKYANCEPHRRNFQNLCTLLEDEYGDIPAGEFGPRRLAELRDLFVASGNNRKYVNSQVRSITKVFKYAVSRELVDVNVLIRLQTLEPLRYGQTTAPESVPRQPVDLETVKATMRELSPTVRAMIRVQAATGMRPSEVCNIRPCDIDRTEANAWVYRPKKHKTAHHGKLKAVPIVGDARLALEPFIDRDSHDFCFSPKESTQWYLDASARAAARRLSTTGTNRGAIERRTRSDNRVTRSPRTAIVVPFSELLRKRESARGPRTNCGTRSRRQYERHSVSNRHRRRQRPSMRPRL